MTEQERAEAQLLDEIEHGRLDEIQDFFVQHLAQYGTGGLDVGRLARRVFERIEEEG